jgi:RNA polymerase sigma-70 factor (ECF subfamily)
MKAAQPSVLPAAAQAAPAVHQESVAELLRNHNRTLHAFLMTRVRDEHEAREIAQEAYVRMLQLTEPGAVSFLRAYLFKTAANIALDRARDRETRARLLRAEFVEEPVDELSPDRRVLSAEDLDVFRRALSELSPKCRRAFVLCRLQGRSDAQAAAELGVQPRMVRHYLRQAGVYCQLRVKGLSPAQAREATP